VTGRNHGEEGENNQQRHPIYKESICEINSPEEEESAFRLETLLNRAKRERREEEDRRRKEKGESIKTRGEMSTSYFISNPR
jgi:hypothetical protein